MKRHLALFWSISLLILLSGCASIGEIKKDTATEDMKALVSKGDEDLNAIQPIVKIPISKKIKYFEVAEPNAFKTNKNISISFNKTPFTTAIRAIAKELKVNTIFDYQKQIDTKSYLAVIKQPETSSKEKAEESKKTTSNAIEYFDRTISLDFKGPVKELFEYLSETTNYFYTFQGNSLIVKERQTFKIIIPNYPGILKEVSENIKALGATNVSYDEITNNISFTADYPTYKRMVEYTEDIRKNMALITMRIIMLNVKLSGEENYGIDWSKMVFGYDGQKSPQPFGIPALASGSSNNSSSSSSTVGTGTTSVTTNIVSATVQEGVGAVFNSTGANIFVQGAKFTLSTFLSFIQNYGKSSVVQNVFVQTLSGKKGKLSAVTETPYVSSVGISSLSNNSSSNQSTATTATAKNGVELEILPSYSKDEGTLTVGLNVGLYGVTRFLTLSAGTLGTFNQPETTKKTVEAILRMSPSQTAIIGGLVFDQKNGNTTGLPGDTYLTNSVQKTSQKEELVIIVKPQVFEFVPQD